MTRFQFAVIGVPVMAMILAGCATGGGEAPGSLMSSPQAGGSILQQLNTADRAQAERARLSALDGKAGQSVTWASSDAPQLRHGSVVAGPVSTQNGLQCRPYTQTVYLDGVPGVARANACRQPDGSWANS